MNVLESLTDGNQHEPSNVISLGERRLQSPTDTLRKLLEDDMRIRSELMKRCLYATRTEIMKACEKAFSAYHRGESLETCVKIGVSVAEALAADRTFGDGPRPAE